KLPNKSSINFISRTPRRGEEQPLVSVLSPLVPRGERKGSLMRPWGLRGSRDFHLDSHRGFRFASPGFDLTNERRITRQSQITRFLRPPNCPFDRSNRGRRA